MLHLTQELKGAFLFIHEVLHNKEYKEVELYGKKIPISLSPNGCRQLYFHNMNFMEQNPKKNSKFGELARQGEKITWGIKGGNWIRIDKDGIHE